MFLALRHLRFARRSSARAFTALAGLAGVACGVAALIFAQALARGVRDELQDKILRGTAHITVQRADGAKFDERETRDLKVRLSQLSDVLEVSATEYAGALLQGRSAAGYCLLRGVDASAPRKRLEIQKTIIAGASDELFKPSANAPSPNDETPILIGAELAAHTGLTRAGDTGEIVSLDDLNASFNVLSSDVSSANASGFDVSSSNNSRSSVSSLSEQRFDSSTLMPNVRRVRVVGVFRTGLADYDASWIYAAQDALGKPTALSVETRDIERAPQIADEIRVQLGQNYAVTDWRAANASLFAALSLERRVVTIIVALIMFIAALNITTTLMLAVVERRAEIAVLRVLGARAANILRIFLFEGLIIGIIGALAGALVGVGACLIANRFQLIRLPPEVYSLAFAPLHLRASDVAFAAGLALVFALLATLYPLRAALRVKPLEILRD
jgi:lipoprotein-releasing system permease protein